MLRRSLVNQSASLIQEDIRNQNNTDVYVVSLLSSKKYITCISNNFVGLKTLFHIQATLKLRIH